MSVFDALRYRIATFRRALLDRAGWRRDVDEEIAFHLELEAMHGRHAGLAEPDARAAARRRFGRPARVRERLADATGIPALETIGHDLRLAARALGRSPGFTVVAALTLGLAIGANALVYGAVRGMLVRPLPFPGAERLVWIYTHDPAAGLARAAVGGDVVERLFAAARPFEAFAVFGDRTFVREEGERPSRWQGLWATPGLFGLLGATPALGRTFTEDDVRDGARVVVIGYERWQSDFAGDSSIIGRVVRLGEEHRTVVGVLPRGLAFPLGRAPQSGNGSGFRLGTQDFWIPAGDRHPGGTVLARLAPAHDLSDAARYTALVHRRMAAEGAGTPQGTTLDVVPLRDQILGAGRPVLRLLQAFAALVLLMACANLANLVLARGSVREREFLVRAALGASPAAVVRVVLTECMLLTAAGGALGMAVAWAGREAMRRATGGHLPLLDQVTLDGPVPLFTAAAGAATIALFGLGPAIAAARAARITGRAGARGHTASVPHARLRSGLVVAQVTLALALLAGAGLVTRSLARLLAVDAGYRAEQVIVADVQLAGGKGYPEFYRALHQRLRRLTGVESVGLIQSTPLTGKWTFTEPFVVPARDADPARAPQVPGSFVAFDYFEAMQVGVVAGRSFTEAEYLRDEPGAIVINETAARRFFPGGGAIGATVTMPGTRRRTVVGVVRDTRDVRLDVPAGPQWYLPLFFEGTQLLVRTSGDPARLVPAVRALLLASDRRLIVNRVEPLAAVVAATVVERRLAMQLLGAFAGVGVALAATGLYGVLSFAVAQRRRELGVRRALGASRRAVAGMVLGQGVGLAAAGVALGILVSLPLSALLRGLLFETSPVDPLTFLSMGAVLLAVAAGTAWIPAWRAANADPAAVLHAD